MLALGHCNIRDVIYISLHVFTLKHMWFIMFFAIAGLWQDSSISEVAGFLSGQFVNTTFALFTQVLFSFVPLRLVCVGSVPCIVYSLVF